MYALEGKVVVVTGAGRRKGLGEAIVRRFAREGCKVMLTDIGAPKGPEFPADAVGTSEEMEAIAAELAAETGTEVATAVCDVRDEAQVEAAVKAAVERFGGLDIWVNNAGIGYLMKRAIEMSAEEWDAVIEVNLRGCFYGIKHAARQMIAQGRGGRLINIASQAAKSGFPFASAYTSSKHALVGLVRATSIELGEHGITVNNVCPNHVTTGLGAWQNEFFSRATGRSLEQYLADMKAGIPLGRPGLPEDTAKACAFLASEEAAYITGESMNVSGGEEPH